MKLDPSKRNLLVTIALCGAVVAYVFLIFLPTQRSISELQLELAGHQSYIAQQQQSGATLVSLQEELNAARHFTDGWREAAPDVRRLARLNATISNCASVSSVQLIQLDPQPAEPMQKLARVPIALVCTGEFQQVFDFLRQIELLPHSIWVEEIVLTKPDDNVETVRCELALVVFADKRGISD